MHQKKITQTQYTNFIIDKSINYKKLNLKYFNNYNKIYIFLDINFIKSNKNFVKHFSKLNKKVVIKKIKSNEKLKSINNYNKLIKFLIKNNCGRKDLLIAVGGGTILDIISFLASTYMRGIDLYMIPTNLIGMADASTGGKTCLNCHDYKNIIGSFYLPKIVYVNINFLKSCPEDSDRQGISEIFKYGLLGSKKLIKLLSQYKSNKSSSLLVKILFLTMNLRFKIRKLNPLASNLGHTFGHAIEKISKYKIKHGDAISIGIFFALKFGEKIKMIKKQNVKKILHLMKLLGLNLEIPKKFNPKTIVKYMLIDKKTLGDNIGLILIKDIGKPYLINKKPFYYVKKKIILDFLSEYKK
jgi:3-dehydroquinate synthase